MNDAPILRVLRDNAFLLVMIGVLILAVGKAVTMGFGMQENFARMGNDDLMRLLTVRDWLAGQGWFDVVQYRLNPPEGVSIHWSRYIDAAIAAIIVPLSYFVPMDTAEQLAVAIYPTVILVLSILVIGFGTRRVFGTTAACFSMLCFVIWPLTADLHSRVGNLDHHNVQLLMMILMAFAVVWPTRPTAAGIVGGLAAAFSLAIGLESLLYIVVVGLIILVRTPFTPNDNARQFLGMFCAALAGGSILLWLGQTAPDARFAPMCDQLGTPVLSLIAIAVAACILPIALGARTSRPGAFIAVAAGATAVGLVLAWPLLANCIDGPYGDLPGDVQRTIKTSITEAKPGIVYAMANPAAAIVFALPVFVAFFLGLAQWVQTRSTDKNAPALLQLLLICVFCIGMLFVQMRTVIMAASVVPMIGGYVIATLAGKYLKTRDLVQGALALTAATLIIAPKLVAQGFAALLLGETTGNAEANQACSRHESLVTLNEVPTGVILNHINYGPAVLVSTHHSVLSAPYHRSGAAFNNGFVPFRLEGPAFEDYVKEATATHILLCMGMQYDSDFVTDLAGGGQAEWLRRVPVSSESQVLFEVLRE